MCVCEREREKDSIQYNTHSACVPESSDFMGVASSRPLHLLNLLISNPDMESRLWCFLLCPFGRFLVNGVSQTLEMIRVSSSIQGGTQPIKWAWSTRILITSVRNKREILVP